MTFASAIEIALSILLAATLVYCAILERRLAALRSGQDGFKETIAQLNTTIVSADAATRLLRTSVATASETLDERLARARGLVDELSLLTSSGDRIAERIAAGATSLSGRGKSFATPPVLSNRLDALKTAHAMGNVR